MNPRIQQLISRFKEHHVDAFLVTSDINIRYLTDFPSAESWLLICPKRVFYLTDFRYVWEARQALSSLRIIIKPYTTSLPEALCETASSMKLRRIGFDDRHVSLATFKKMTEHSPKTIRWIPIPKIVEEWREIKSTYEINQIKKALKIHDQAQRYLKSMIRPGLTEKYLLKRLEDFVRSKEAFFSFPPIIASGPNSCFPHAKVTARRLRSREVVLTDMGIDFQGYKSDLTRMVFLGTIPRFVKEIHDIVRRAQALAIEKVKAGVLASDVDAEARRYLAHNGVGKFFGHSLGHGVGLEIHEAPSISQKNPSPLKEGMIFTIEPAVYLPHKFGIRIEDMVLVSAQGCEVLSADIH